MINNLYEIKVNNYMKKQQKRYNNTKCFITLEKNCWKIKINNHNYTIKIIKQKNEYYIKLTPYKKTYFQTKLTLRNIASKLDMTLFAMKENEKQ